jgi:hypothetical protein
VVKQLWLRLLVAMTLWIVIVCLMWVTGIITFT